MPTMLEAAKRLSRIQHEHILDALRVLDDKGPAIAHRVVMNVEAELRAPDVVWTEVFNSLLPVDLRIRDSDTAARVLLALRTALTRCLAHAPNLANVPSREPVGPVVNGLNPKAYGRLMAVPSLIYYWKTSILGPSATGARKPRVPANVIRELLLDLQTDAGLTARRGSRLFERLPLGFYILWSTFDQNGFSQDPFPAGTLKLAELAALLGLDRDLLFGEDKAPTRCVLMNYTLPSNVRPRVPTIVEAYAGSGRINFYFEVYRHEVDVSLEQFPRTLPAPKAQDKRGLPEVVHEVVFASQLSAPIRLARFSS